MQLTYGSMLTEPLRFFYFQKSISMQLIDVSKLTGEVALLTSAIKWVQADWTWKVGPCWLDVKGGSMLTRHERLVHGESVYFSIMKWIKRQ
jgi:hypothetical protein